ncbi:hypothetical protein TM233_13500 [Bradyrhizobium sp. TM233]|nr:hypothetical protein TM233_13500 [Bradyrhizobium sp. TM233]
MAQPMPVDAPVTTTDRMVFSPEVHAIMPWIFTGVPDKRSEAERRAGTQEPHWTPDQQRNTKVLRCVPGNAT